MIALIRKEVEELWALFALAVFVLVMVGWAHLTVPLGHFGGQATLNYLIEDAVIIGCLAAFTAGHTRFGPEYQQGTLAFLDALPTSRTRVFVVKYAVGSLPLLITAVGVGLMKAWALTVHPLPNDVSVIPLVLAVMVISGALMAAHYTTGLVLSFFGDVGWQALLVSSFAMMMLTIIVPSMAQWYPLFSGVVRVNLVNGWPMFAVAPLVLWLLWTFGATVVAWLLFLGPGDRIVAGPWWIRGPAQVLVYGPPVLLILISVVMSTLGSAIQLPQLIQPTYRETTEHFRVLATRSNRVGAKKLVAEAEDVRAKIVARFGADGPERLDLELTGSSEHLGGVFVPGKIQLRVGADAQTLAHELSHAWSHALGAPPDPDAWRFFEEGLATYNEAVVGPPASQAAVPLFGTPQSDWFLAPQHQSRSRKFNPDDDYAIGQLWAEAIVEVGGADAPSCIIRAAAANSRDGDDGIPWWRELLDTCGLALNDVVAAYEAQLPTGVPPDMIGWYAGLDGSYYVVPTTPSPEGSTVVCSARSSPAAPRTEYTFSFTSGREGPCRLQASQLPSDRFQLSVGYVENEQTRMGPWRSIKVP